MSYLKSNTTEAFVNRVVRNHDFACACEWVDGLDVLSDMSDADIDCCFNSRAIHPCDLDDIADGFFGVTEEQARLDRELFDRIVGECSK